MRPKIYVETSIISYLAARSSQHEATATDQRRTHEWWANRDSYELYSSELVIEEAGRGDPSAAEARLRLLESMAPLPVTEAAENLARTLIRGGSLPAKAGADALHIAVAVMSGMDYLLTWNCRHIANATKTRTIEAICRAAGFEPPTICTPPNLIGAPPDG